MIDLSKLSDPYERKARVYPALMCLLPPILSLSVVYPSIYTSFVGLIVIAAGVGGVQFLAQIARDAGKNLEDSLFQSWGGMPSVSILRHSDKNIPRQAKNAYHSRLSSMTGIEGPTPEQEQQDPDSADDCYRSWSDVLRASTRDTNQYPLVFKENINYGFRRNFMGLKTWCMFFSFIGLIVAFSPCVFGDFPSESQLIAATTSLIYGAAILAIVKSEWVRVPADSYAKQLVETINILGND